MEQAEPAADDEPVVPADVVGEPESRRDDHRRPRVVVLGNALAGLHDPVRQVSGIRHSLPDREARTWTERHARERIHRLTGARGARVDVVRAHGDVQARLVGRVPPIQEEVRRLLSRVIGRLHPDEPHAVVERQPRVHAPVVLHVPLEIVVDVGALDILRLLLVGAEDPQRRVREAEAGVERVVRVIGEVEHAHVRHPARRTEPLSLVRVVPIAAGLERVASDDLRDADRRVLRAVHVDLRHAAHRVGHSRRARHAADQAAPLERRHERDGRAAEPGHARLAENLDRVVVRREHGAVRPVRRSERHREVRHPAETPGSRRADGQRAQRVPPKSVRPFDEGRGVRRPVEGGGPGIPVRREVPRVVEAWHRAGQLLRGLELARELPREAQGSGELVVDADCRLGHLRLRHRLRHFQVVRLSGHLRVVGQRQQAVVAERHETGDVEPILGNSAEHAAVPKAAAGVRGRARQARGGIANQIDQTTQIVERLREVSAPLQLRGHAKPRDRATGRARPVLMAVEEEQFVVPAGAADRATDRVPPVPLLRHRLRITVQSGSPRCCRPSPNCARCRTAIHGTGSCRPWSRR